MCSLESVCAVLESRMLKTLAQSPKTGPILVDCMRNAVDTAGATRACYGHGMAPYVWPRCGATLVLASDFLSSSYFIRCFYRAARFDGHFH